MSRTKFFSVVAAKAFIVPPENEKLLYVDRCDVIGN
jgi:hypothetical protein